MILNPSETDIQIAIVDYLSLISARHGFLFFAVPNEAMQPSNGRTLSGGEYGRIKRLKRMGLTAGVADLVLTHKGRAYFLECKKPGGQLSDNQKLFRQRALDCGAEYVVVKSVDDVISALGVWGIL